MEQIVVLVFDWIDKFYPVIMILIIGGLAILCQRFSSKN